MRDDVDATHRSEFPVTIELSAERHGNPGFPVLSTPSLLGLFEKAAIAAMASRLQPGEGSVGTGATIRHLAATPIGQTVTIETRIVEADGKRLAFEMRAHDASEPIGECRHERFIVDVAKFNQRLAKKAGPTGT
jgi:predicted thioesterase